jgi:large conductance mechanosensitive channel protein
MRGFKQFLLRINAVDLAVVIVIGATFAGLLSAVVKDLLTPLIGAVARVPAFSQLNFTINGSKLLCLHSLLPLRRCISWSYCLSISASHR